MPYLARYRSLKNVMTTTDAGRAFGCGTPFVHSLCVDKPYGLTCEDVWRAASGERRWYVNGITLAEKVPELGVRA